VPSRLGFDQVVIRPGVQTRNTIAHLSARGDEDNRRCQPLPPQPSDEADAVDLWHHDIQHKNLVGVVFDCPARFGAVLCAIHHMPSRAQTGRQVAQELGIIFRKEEFHGISKNTLGRATLNLNHKAISPLS
jgi:hypothetical protein